MNSSGRFLGMQPKLGQAFSLVCLIKFGPLLPIESTGHLKELMALSVWWKSPSQPGISVLGGPRLFSVVLLWKFASIDEVMTTWSQRLAQMSLDF